MRWPATRRCCWQRLHGRELDDEVNQAAQLLATVVGHDLDRDTDGVFRIAHRVAADRVISTVDPQARHGHKTSAHGFDGYKGHLAIDPDAEIVTATEVTAANAGDAEPAPDLLADNLPDDLSEDTNADAGAGDGGDDDPNPGTGGGADAPEGADRGEDRPAVYGDAAYGTGKLLARLETAGAQIFTKVQPPTAPGGRFTKERFTIDLDSGTVTCPNVVTVAIRPATTGGGTAVFGAACAACPLAARVHRLGRRTHHHDQRLRGRTGPCPRRPGRSRLGRRLPGDPPEGGTQDRSPDAPPPRRAPRPSARHHEGRRRLLTAGRRGQPGPPRCARTAPSHRPRLASRAGMTTQKPSRTVDSAKVPMIRTSEWAR